MSELHVLIYEYVENMTERRAPYRAGHLETIRRYREEGRLEMAGALGVPPHGGLVVFRDPADAAAFAAEDPYGAAGLIVSSRVEPWTLVT